MCSDNFLGCCAADSNKPYIVQTIAKNNHEIENNERILTMGISNITLKILFLGAFRLYLFDYWFLDHKESLFIRIPCMQFLK